MFDLQLGRPERAVNVDDMFSVIGYSRATKKILVAHHGATDYDNQITILDPWDGAIRPLIHGPRGYRWSPWPFALSASGEYLAASVFQEVRPFLFVQRRNTVTIWNVRTGEVISETITDVPTNEGLSCSVYSLVFCPTGNLLVGRRGAVEQVSLR